MIRLAPAENRPIANDLASLAACKQHNRHGRKLLPMCSLTAFALASQVHFGAKDNERSERSGLHL